MPVTAGGSFIPSADITLTGAVTLSGATTISGGLTLTGTNTIGAGATLTSPTLTSPTITGATQTLTTATLAAAGNSQATAGAIVSPSGSFILVSGADATKGVVLPAAAAGLIYYIKGIDNAVLKVYPNTSDVINALSGDAALSMAAKTAAVFIAYDATTWYTFSLLPS
jgi:hypothetical protein